MRCLHTILDPSGSGRVSVTDGGAELQQEGQEKGEVTTGDSVGIQPASLRSQPKLRGGIAKRRTGRPGAKKKKPPWLEEDADVPTHSRLGNPSGQNTLFGGSSRFQSPLSAPVFSQDPVSKPLLVNDTKGFILFCLLFSAVFFMQFSFLPEFKMFQVSFPCILLECC